MDNILEMIMMICFGFSWPINVYKLYKSKSTKSTSPFFYFLIIIGYLVGIASKVIKLQKGITTPGYVWFFYILNAAMVTGCVCVWFRNKRIEKKMQKS